MLFSLVLVIATMAAWALGRRSSSWPDHARRGLAAAMVVAGTGHLLGPEPFLQHLPTWVPAREALVYGSGLVEIGLGLALLSPARRVTAGRLLALFLLAVWPANFYVALAGVDVAGQPGGIYPWLRLPFQLLFIAWALWSTRPSVPLAPGEVTGAPVTATTITAARGSDAHVRWSIRSAGSCSSCSDRHRRRRQHPGPVVVQEPLLRAPAAAPAVFRGHSGARRIRGRVGAGASTRAAGTRPG